MQLLIDIEMQSWREGLPADSRFQAGLMRRKRGKSRVNFLISARRRGNV
jgi:hypothetical protein